MAGKPGKKKTKKKAKRAPRGKAAEKKTQKRGCLSIGLRTVIFLVILMVGMSLVSVIAAIAIPSLLAARMDNNQSGASSALHAYASAQTIYKKEKGTYANSLPALRATESPLLSAEFAAAHRPGGRPRKGYLFVEPTSIGGRKVDWKKNFALCAWPASYGRGGYLTFIVTTDGTVWAKDLKKDKTGPLEDFPANPQEAGWMIAK